MAQTDAVYSSGVLVKGVDPTFPNTLRGLVEAINYTISKYQPNAVFGWQFNLWASPAGGFTNAGITGKGIVRLTDTLGLAKGRNAIYNEAKAIANYYVSAGILTHGAKLSASTSTASMRALRTRTAIRSSPRGSGMRRTDELPDLRQCAAQHHAAARDPVADPGGPHQLDHRDQPVHEREVPGPDEYHAELRGLGVHVLLRRYLHDDRNSRHILRHDRWRPVAGQHEREQSHLGVAPPARPRCGCTVALFGPGVGDSTDNVGSGESYYWISKVQNYYKNPIALVSSPVGIPLPQIRAAARAARPGGSTAARRAARIPARPRCRRPLRS